MSHNNTVRISPRIFAWFQFGMVTLLVLLGLFYYVYQDFYADDVVNAVFEIFDVGDESSIPTVFSCFNLLLAFVLAFIIYHDGRRHGDKLALGWLVLSLTLLFLALDEGAEIHERAGTRFLEGTGLDLPFIQDHKWLLAGGLLTLVVAPLFIPFLLRLERRTSLLLLLSGAIFLGGALGLEFLGAWMMHEHGYVKSDLIYRVRRVMEEAFEMYGIALLNCTLLGLIATRGINLTLITGVGPSPSPAGR